MTLFDNLFKKPNLAQQKEQIAKFLQVDTKALEDFENAYQAFESPAIKRSEITKTASNELIERIVQELINGCEVIAWDGNNLSTKVLTASVKPVELSEITELPPELQPELTGRYLKKDIKEPAYVELINQLMLFEKTGNPNFYHRFRQGLDLLDLDPIVYEMLSCNKNSMGYWLPKITDAVAADGFFKIPATKITKVPITLLQLTRREYMTLTKSTLEIVNRWAQRVFELDESKKYFLKTGTYSSKFDFRNAKINDPDEVKDIGEYLLYIHFSALQMAHYDLRGKNPVIYGVCTTNEWVVRDFIEDIEHNPCIYHGMPLHTEYRVFVDFSTKEVFGVHPYWDPAVMKDRFDNYSDSLSPDMLHDSVIYRAHEAALMKKYEANKETILAHIKTLTEASTELTGQWSIDIMQNGNKFYLIDMAVAERSAFYKDVIPESKRKPMPENWIPKIGG